MSAVQRWRAAFYLVERRQTRCSHKTTGRDVTAWIGLVGGERFVVRVTPRTRIEGEHFLTSSNQRLRESNVGRGGYFLDVEVLSGRVDGPNADALAAMICAVEDEEGSAAPYGSARVAHAFARGTSPPTLWRSGDRARPERPGVRGFRRS